MKKHFIILATGLVLSALALSGCGSGEAVTEQNIQQSDNLAIEEQPNEAEVGSEIEEYVYKSSMDVEFTFGTKSGIYTGEVNENGVPDGNGTFVAQNSSGISWEYTGDWENGHWNSLGTSAWESGQFYAGMYKNDAMTGFGTLFLPDVQMTATGYFDNGTPLGYCTLYLNDGSTFFGFFTEGWQAQGELFNQDGTSYSAAYDGSQFTEIELAPEPEEEIIIDAPAAITWYGAGTYKIGVDLPAGEYCIKSTSTTPAYYCVSSDSQGDSILDNENFSGYYFVTVADGQYLQISRGKLTESSNISDIADKSALESGMYRVGIDIPAGEYKLQNQNDKMGYFAVYDNSSINKDIIQNDNFEGSAYVTVCDGQYLYLTRCTGAIVE